MNLLDYIRVVLPQEARLSGFGMSGFMRLLTRLCRLSGQFVIRLDRGLFGFLMALQSFHGLIH